MSDGCGENIVSNELLLFRLEAAEEKIKALDQSLKDQAAEHDEFVAEVSKRELRQLRWGVSVLGIVVMSLGGFVINIVRGKIGI